MSKSPTENASELLSQVLSVVSRRDDDERNKLKRDIVFAANEFLDDNPETELSQRITALLLIQESFMELAYICASKDHSAKALQLRQILKKPEAAARLLKEMQCDTAEELEEDFKSGGLDLFGELFERIGEKNEKALNRSRMMFLAACHHRTGNTAEEIAKSFSDEVKKYVDMKERGEL